VVHLVGDAMEAASLEGTDSSTVTLPESARIAR